MKKIKLIVPVISCLLAAPLFSCANNNEQPESNYYKISISNGLKSPTVTFDNSNLIKKGEACDVLIRVEPFTELRPIDDHPSEIVRVCKANQLSLGEPLDPNCYTFERTASDPCVYELKIPKEYMTTSYDVDMNSRYVRGYDDDGEIVFSSSSTLKATNAEIYVANTACDEDLLFYITPKDFQSGYTFNGETKEAIKIYGVDSNNARTLLTTSRNELVLCDSPIQGLGHYQTLTKRLRIAVPTSELYVPSTSTIYGYEQKFEKIEIESLLTDPIAYDITNYEKLFNPIADTESCTLKSTPKLELKNDGVHYIAEFTANTNYAFATDNDNFLLTDLSVLPNTYVPTGRPYFRDFEIHADESKRKDINVSPYNAYHGTLNSTLWIMSNTINDKKGNVYVPMGKPLPTDNAYWLDLITTSSTDLKVDINVTRMVKYVELPVSTIFDEYYLTEYDNYFYECYQDGSIDFIKSVNFTIKATSTL